MSPTMDPDGIQDGRIVGRYMLCDAIASGGMATVHLGRLMGPVGFARTVAIKRLHPHFARDPEFVAMFLDEARVAARIRHPNVVSTLDVVVLKGELFVVMDYVHGESLSRLMRASRAATGGGIPVPHAMSIIANVLYGLHSAHEAKDDHGRPLHIVHRDVSPQNVLVGIDGVARVVDFGVAKAVGRLQTTQDGTLKGKIAYMSPEQISVDTIDGRSDVYAASVVLWEMLVGRRLFDAGNEVRTLQRIVQAKVDPPSVHVPGLPPEVDALVMRGLAKDPDQRFATAWEMAEHAQRVAYATPGQVAELVRQLAGKSFLKREASVAEMESKTPAISAALVARASQAMEVAEEAEDASEAPTTARAYSLPPAPPPPSSGPLPAPTSQVTDFSVASPPGLRTPVPIWIGAVLVGAFMLVAGTAGYVVLARHRSVASSPPVVPATSAPVATAPPPPTPTTRAVELPAHTAAAPPLTGTAPAVAAPPVTAAETSPPPATAKATVTPPVTATATAPKPVVKTTTHHAVKPTGHCNPPYVLDAQGMRIPKPECL